MFIVFPSVMSQHVILLLSKVFPFSFLKKVLKVHRRMEEVVHVQVAGKALCVLNRSNESDLHCFCTCPAHNLRQL